MSSGHDDDRSIDVTETRGSRGLVGNYAVLVAAEIVAKGLTFAAFAYLARAVGTVGIGHIEFAVAVTLCAGLVIDLGFNPYGAREIARSPGRTRGLIGEIVAARLALTAAAIGVILLLALAPEHAPMRMRLLLIFGLSLVPMPFFLNWVFQGHDQMGVVALATLIRQGVFATVVFGFVRTMDDVWIVAVGEAVGVACAVGFCLWMYRRRFSANAEVSQPHTGRDMRRLFREGVPIGLGQMFWAMRMFAGTVVLGLMATETDVGLYGAAQRILVAAHTFIWLYFFNLLPSMTRAWGRGGNEFSALVSRSMRWVLLVSIVAAIPGVILADRIMSLAYGADFESGGAALKWFAMTCVVLAVSGHYRFGLIAAGRQKAEMITAGIGAGAALALIPVGYKVGGPGGAAFGLLLAEAAVWGMTWLVSRRALGLTGHSALLWRPIGGVVLAVLLATMFSTVPAAALAALACASYVVLVAASDAVLRRDIRDSLLALRRRLRDAPRRRSTSVAM